MEELCYRLKELPDLSLNKYSSLEETGVSGVLEKHLAFLRIWNRKGIFSKCSIHLFYYYVRTGEEGSKLEVLFMVRGSLESLRNVDQMVSASPLSEFFDFIGKNLTFEVFLKHNKLSDQSFDYCSVLLKKEVFIKSTVDDSNYYVIPEWEMNDEGRLFNMCKLMQSFDETILYRVDLYPVEKNETLRNDFKVPMARLREKQNARNGGERDYEAENTLKKYQDMLDGFDEFPHFASNIFVFAENDEDSTIVLDSAGAEALVKGNYAISTFKGNYHSKSFLTEDRIEEIYDLNGKVILTKLAQNSPVLTFSREAENNRLRYLPTLFTLEEIAPFFRFPALYDGEVIQRKKETAPIAVNKEDGLHLGYDENGYDVYFPLKNLSKHAFISGVPGSGKTNTMHHLTSTLWIEHKIPFLVLEPAKQEYRALANQKGMEDLYIFSPNANMSFPLHINPFEFPKGLMLAEHIRTLGHVFEGAFPLEPPMPNLLDTAIEAVYKDLGWSYDTLYTNETKLKFPTMTMVYERLEKILDETDYSSEISGNLKSALEQRIGSLLKREMGDIFDVPMSTIPPEKWLTIPAVIELESMGSGPANFLTLLLCSLIRESLKVQPFHDKDYARHVIFLEEAHNLIGPESEEVYGAEANPKQSATAFIVKMLAEVRALKQSIIIADQLPTVMADEVLKNTGLKIGMRLTSMDDRGVLGGTMSATPLQLEDMGIFNTGEALVSYEGLMRPFKIKVNEWRKDVIDNVEKEYVKTSKSDNELKEMIKWRTPYVEACERSFLVDYKKFNREYASWMESSGKLVPRLKKINECQKNHDLAKEDLLNFRMAATQLMNDYSEIEYNYFEENLIRKIEEENDKFKEAKKILINNHPSGLIDKGLSLVIKIQNRKTHWKKLGIYERLMDEEFVGNQEIMKNIRNIQKTLMVCSQRLFIIGKQCFIEPKEVKKQIENMIQELMTIDVENIMESDCDGK